MDYVISEKKYESFRSQIFFLPLLIICFIFLSCTTGKQQTKDEKPTESPPGFSVLPFFPLNVGNTWHYTGHHLGEPRDHKVRIAARDGIWFRDTEGEKYIIDSDGLRSPERYMLRGPLQKGMEWSSVVGLSVTEHYEITEVGATVTVPAGTFYGCVKVRGRVRINHSITLFKEDTYCPRKGLVRIYTWLDESGKRSVPQGELLLQSYHLVD